MSYYKTEKGKRISSVGAMLALFCFVRVLTETAVIRQASIILLPKVHQLQFQQPVISSPKHVIKIMICLIVKDLQPHAICSVALHLFLHQVRSSSCLVYNEILAVRQ